MTNNVLVQQDVFIQYLVNEVKDGREGEKKEAGMRGRKEDEDG